MIKRNNLFVLLLFLIMMSPVIYLYTKNEEQYFFTYQDNRNTIEGVVNDLNKEIGGIEEKILNDTRYFYISAGKDIEAIFYIKRDDIESVVSFFKKSSLIYERNDNMIISKSYVKYDMMPVDVKKLFHSFRCVDAFEKLTDYKDIYVFVCKESNLIIVKYNTR